MRITGGEAKGLHLVSPKGSNIRPTSDRVREAIFSIIGQDLSGIGVLDLFAGTGVLGLEALSRGATQVVYVDKSPKSIRIIKKNLALSNYENSESVLIVKKDLTKGFPANNPYFSDPFDLVFLDPPYGKNLARLFIEEFTTGNMLRHGSLVVAESGKHDELPGSSENLKKIVSKIYGDTKITIYTNEVKK